MTQSERLLKTMAHLTNLRVLRPNRKLLQAGDLFVMQIGDVSCCYLFGRVMALNLPREQAPMPGSHLVYTYRALHDSKRPPLGELRPDQLLLPPVYINRMPWTKGYFEPAGHYPLGTADWLSRHCFRRWDGKYVNEAGAVISERTEPCGDWVLISYRRFDDIVSDALSIPRVPESPC